MSPPDSNPPGRETAEAAWPSPPLGAGLEPSFQSAIEKGAPAAIWALGDATALWWNEAGAVLFELPEAKDAPPPVRAALSRAAGSDRPWLERWRLVLQRRAMLATLLLGRARLDDGTEGLIIAATEVAPPIASNGHATPPAPLLARASEEGIETSERKSTRADEAQPHTLPSGATTAHASSRRLTWQTDASGRLLAGPPGTSLSQALGRGAPMQPALLSELFAKGGPSVEEAIASGRPVSGVPVETIPAPDGSSLIGVLFGAPVLDQGRKAAGHRGFFVVSEMRPAPPQASSSETSSHEARSLPQLSTPGALEEGMPAVGVTPPGEAAPAQSADELGDIAVSEEVVETAEASALGSSAGPTPPLGDKAGQLLAVRAQILSHGQGGALAPEPNEAGFRASNVISLRKPGAEPARPREKEAAPELSPAERDAFADIAKALGAAWPAQNVQREKSASTSRPDEKAEKAGEVPEKPPGEDRAAEAGQAETPSQPRGFPEASVDDLSTLIDRLPIGILVHRSGAALAANKTLLDLLGHESFEAFEASGGIEELFAEPNPKAGARKHVAITARDGQIVEVDARCQAIKWRGEAATLLSLRRSLHGETQSLEAAGHRSAVAAKDAEVGEWRALVDLATDGVVTIDELGRVVAMSASAEKLFGYAAKEISGEALAVLIAPDCHRSLAAELEEARGAASKAATREPHEITGRTREGRRISLSMRLQAGKPREGQLSAPSRRWHAIFRDLTANKDSEAGLVEARVAAERMTAQKSEFLAKVSHEIRTPLNSIVGFADIIAEERFGPLENERYKEYIKDIRASGTHIISLVNDLLDLSKIESGRMELSLAPVNLNAEVAAGVALVQMDAARSRVLMRQSLAQGLPSVIADARSVKQILLNILSNAVKFTEPGGQVIVSTALTEKGEVIFRARDTGIGMSERELAEALEPFKQFATALRPGGSGLGLSLTKALVKANQANLSIASHANEGTLVEVVFPRTRVLAA